MYVDDLSTVCGRLGLMILQVGVKREIGLADSRSPLVTKSTLGSCDIVLHPFRLICNRTEKHATNKNGHKSYLCLHNQTTARDDDRTGTQQDK